MKINYSSSQGIIVPVVLVKDFSQKFLQVTFLVTRGKTKDKQQQQSAARRTLPAAAQTEGPGTRTRYGLSGAGPPYPQSGLGRPWGMPRLRPRELCSSQGPPAPWLRLRASMETRRQRALEEPASQKYRLAKMLKRHSSAVAPSRVWPTESNLLVGGGGPSVTDATEARIQPQTRAHVEDEARALPAVAGLGGRVEPFQLRGRVSQVLLIPVPAWLCVVQVRRGHRRACVFFILLHLLE